MYGVVRGRRLETIDGIGGTTECLRAGSGTALTGRSNGRIDGRNLKEWERNYLVSLRVNYYYQYHEISYEFNFKL